MRRLLGLEDVLSIGFCGPTHDEDSWTFDLDPGGVDPVLKIPRLKDAYLKRFPDYQKGITVPAIVDVPTGEVVTNDFAQMTLDFSTEWAKFHREGAPRLYPEELRDEIDEVAQRIYTEVNNGVYRCGFAGSQESYDKAYDRLFTALDWLEERLTNQRYLVGDTITEVDVRLFTTLARFDPVYHGHFKCNRQKLSEMPVLWAYARDLFQTPGFGDTIDFVQIKQHYYIVHKDINPTQIVPKGPDLVQLAHAARSGNVRRQAFWGRHAARTHAAGRTRTGRARGGLGPDRAHRPLRVRHRELVACVVADQGRQLHRDAKQPAAVRIHGGDGDRKLRVGPELVDDVGTLVGPHQYPWSAGYLGGHRQLHRVTRVDGEFAIGPRGVTVGGVEHLAVPIRPHPHQLAVRIGADLRMFRRWVLSEPPDQHAGQHRRDDHHDRQRGEDAFH